MVAPRPDVHGVRRDGVLLPQESCSVRTRDAPRGATDTRRCSAITPHDGIVDQTKVKKEVLVKLAELGGQAFKDDDIKREGDKLILPVGMDEEGAIRFLQRKIEENEQYTTFSRKFNFRPWDGGYCTYQAFKKAFGAVVHNSSTVQGLFGPQKMPPQIITLEVGPGIHEQIPWGNFEVPFLPGVEFSLGDTYDEEHGLVFQVTVSSPRKYKAQVEGLFVLIEEELRNNSIYRGKAMDGKTMPGFLDLDAVDPDKVVYAKDTMTQLEASVWSLIRYSDEHRKLRIPLKRAVLIEGPYGTGKTLAATLTAQEAVANGWTFLYARPGKDDLNEVMQTARLYQPSVVFFEDMDTVADPQDADEVDISKMLDLFDGISAKGTEILAILTTNHKDKIHKGMVRPGRLDAVIHVGKPDAEGIEKLIRAAVPDGKLADSIEFPPITQAMEGFLPSFIKEASDRAFRYALIRCNGNSDEVLLDTEDFINAANGLRPQLELMEGAKETADREPLAEATKRIVNEQVTEVVRESFDPRLLRPAE